MNSKLQELQLTAPSILARVLSDVTDDVEGFRELTRGKYFFKKISAYTDSSGKPKLSLALIFLQDYYAPLERLDDRVIEAVRSSLASQKLTKVVNDLVVNMTHLRDDVKVG